MKKSTLLMFFFVISLSLFSQNKYFRELHKTRIMTEKEYEDGKKILDLRAAKYKGKLENRDSIVETKSFEDGILYVFDRFIIMHPKGNRISVLPEDIFKMINKELPYFKLYDINGKEYNLNDFKGKPMLINFWFHTCGPCRTEMPTLNLIKEKYGDKVHFVSITYDSKEEISPILERIPFNFIHLINAGEYTKKLGLQGAPKNIFVDKNGVIRQIYDKVDDIYDEQTNSVKLGDGAEFISILDKLLAE